MKSKLNTQRWHVYFLQHTIHIIPTSPSRHFTFFSEEGKTWSTDFFSFSSSFLNCSSLQKNTWKNIGFSYLLPVHPHENYSAVSEPWTWHCVRCQTVYMMNISQNTRTNLTFITSYVGGWTINGTITDGKLPIYASLVDDLNMTTSLGVQKGLVVLAITLYWS